MLATCGGASLIDALGRRCLGYLVLCYHSVNTDKFCDKLSGLIADNIPAVQARLVELGLGMVFAADWYQVNWAPSRAVSISGSHVKPLGAQQYLQVEKD